MSEPRTLLATARALGLVTAVSLLTACGPAWEPPDIAEFTGEPQVAAKIRAARGKALDEPGSAEAVGRLGMVFHAHDLNTEAVACYARAMELEKGVPRWPYLAALATAVDDFEGSIPHFERAAELGYDQPALHVNHGDALSRLGRVEGARQRYRKALEIDGATTHALYGLAQLALAEGDVEAAAADLERATAKAPWHGEAHTLLAQVYQRLGRERQARDELTRAGAYGDSSGTPDRLLAAVKAEAVSYVAFRQRGQRFADQGRFAEAEEQFRKALAVNPGNAIDFSNLGGAMAGQGRTREALEQYGKALEIDPDDVFTHNNMGMALAGVGELDGAAERLSRALELDPTYADAQRNLGLVRAQQGRHAEAAELYRRALEQNPSLAKAHTDLGTALAALGDLPAAMEEWRRTLDIDPRELTAVLNLSNAHILRGEHRQAVDRLRRGLAIAPDSSRLISLLAWELATAPSSEVRDAVEAERLARRVYDAYPTQPQAGDVLAAALAAQQRFTEAVPVAERALAQARQVGQGRLAGEIGLRLRLYRRQQAYRQSG